jgi:small subunit ribosomal protein S9
MEMINAVGRRKAAVARVYLSVGKGNVTVNGKDVKEYITVPQHLNSALAPLALTQTDDKYDVKVNVYGGGVKGQAGAIQLGIARALLEIDPEFRAILKPAKMLTRDAREVERKKPGQPKARKRFQFSKR